MKLIACVDMNFGLGFEGKLLYHIKNDLARFKELTTGGVIIMGKKTLDSFPLGKPLPNRLNVVLTSRDLKSDYENLIYMHSKEEVLEFCKDKENVWCIGGGSIYKLFKDECDEIELTYIHDNCMIADTHLYNYLEDPNYVATPCSNIMYDESNRVNYQFLRITPVQYDNLYRKDVIISGCYRRN